MNNVQTMLSPNNTWHDGRCRRYSKTILAFNLLGRPVFPERMIAAIETITHFKTYQRERNPSFIANCNTLIALLSVPDPSKHSAPIFKATSFICDLWYNGDATDKWAYIR